MLLTVLILLTTRPLIFTLVKALITFTNFWNKYWFPILLAIIAISYFGGLFTVIYGIDARIYASVSKEVSESSNWTELYLHGADYLDKPPLHFWLSALSFKIFGISSFSYKLPSFLFTILGTYSTFRLGKLLYSESAGKLAALIYFSSLTIIISNQDVRTDSLLTNVIIFSIWQLTAHIRTKNWLYFIGGFIGIGLAMLSKGPIGLLIPAVAIGTDLMINKEWNTIFHWKWILGLAITTLTISPALIGLYTQFDSQPEKSFALSSGTQVTNYSGIKFYLWDQSFGRIFGGNVEKWDNGLGPDFFFHTYIWAFFPWFIIGVTALVKAIKTYYNTRIKREWITLAGILFTFLVITLSSYKLPHYINPIIPFFAILSGHYLASSTVKKWIKSSQVGIGVISLVATTAILVLFTPTTNILILFPIITIGTMLILSIFLKEIEQKMITMGALSVAVVSFTLNYQFIPDLTRYHAAYQACEIANKHDLEFIYTNNITQALSFDIYYEGKLLELTDMECIEGKAGIYVYKDMFEHIKTYFDIDTVYELQNRELSSISLPFLMKDSRKENVETFYFFIIDN